MPQRSAAVRRETGSWRCQGEAAASRGGGAGNEAGKLVPVLAASARLCREAGLLSNERRPAE